jgi:DNA-binding helix-hairpin-helix protein with protein kinase domain
MDGILAPGDKVRLEGTQTWCVIESLLGAGGQGEVYRSRIGNRPVAVKWYYPDSATPEQRASLANSIRTGMPDSRFLWPEALADQPGSPLFGYVMGLRDDHYGNIADLLNRRIGASFRTLATAGVHLADGYYNLHAKGLCYRDISHNNVFFAPATGDVLICDNDNVGPVGMPSPIGGTMSYMAPEVVRRETPPSVQTDLYSLGVLLFMMLMNHHPLLGAREASIHCFDNAAMEKLFGDDPLFIWDPHDPSNRPDEEFQGNALLFWAIYPTFLKDLFVEAFTRGLNHPDQRIREGQWRQAMNRLRDTLIYCVGCKRQNFYDLDRVRATGGDVGQCWACGKKLQVPPRIRIGRNVVMLNHDSELYPHHRDESGGYDFTKPFARVVEHPSRPGVWGLKNLSESHWATVRADGHMQQVNPGQSVSLNDGAKVQFGEVEAEIRAS